MNTLVLNPTTGRRLASAYSVARAHADYVEHGPLYVDPLRPSLTAGVEHHCQCCGLWIMLGDIIVLGEQAGWKWWVHKKCPSVYENVAWLTEREIDHVVGWVADGRSQCCTRCRERATTFALVRRPGMLPRRSPLTKHSDYVCKGCVRL